MPRARKGRLIVCGLGAAPPQTATLESIRLLRSCGLVVGDLDAGARKGLARTFGLSCGPLGRARGDRLISRMKKGETIGVAAQGQPLSFGPLVKALRARAVRAGIPCLMPPAGPSALDAALALTRQALGFSLSAVTVLERPECAGALPGALVVSWAGGGAEFLKRLAALEPGDKGCLHFRRRGSGWDPEARRVSWQSLRAAPRRLRAGDLLVAL